MVSDDDSKKVEGTVTVDGSGSGVALPNSQLEVYGLGTMKAYVVLEEHLDKLTESSGEASVASSFFWGFFGAFAAAVLGAILTPVPHTWPGALYVLSMIAFAGFSAWFGVQWRRAATKRNETLHKIQTRTTPITLPLAPPPATQKTLGPPS